VRDDNLDVDEFDQDELTRQALAADPHAPLNPDAIPWHGAGWPTGLPDWYMPRAIAVQRGRTTKVVVWTVIAGFVLINAFGLCVTSGFISVA